MAPMLNAGIESFDALTQEARDYGAVMSNDAVAAGAAFNDSLTKM
jgi:hypothetical protein